MATQFNVASALKWLQNHHVVTLGCTSTGICVLEEATKQLPNGEIVGNDITVWLPANINVLRDWMNY